MIAGLQKMTLLDYPGKVACTVFLQGCNFVCPFCHNSGLLPKTGEPLMTMEDFFSFLKKRVGLLDAVCVSGGEPTLCPELEQLLRGIRELVFLVKLDTTGSRPKLLRRLVEDGLVNYVAMDIKNGPSFYAATCGLPHLDLSVIEESIRYLLSGVVPYEFRTTVVDQLHSEVSMEEMGKWLRDLAAPQKPPVLYLQSFVDRESVAFAGLSAAGEEKMASYVTLLTPYIEKVTVRNM